MNWNHRIVRVETGELMFAEVFYNEDGSPAGYTTPFMMGENMGALNDLIAQLQIALMHPILNHTDMKYVPVEEENEEGDIIELTRDDVMKKLNPNPDECPLCGNAETCEECK